MGDDLSFGETLRARRMVQVETDPTFSLRQVAGRVGIEPSYLRARSSAASSRRCGFPTTAGLTRCPPASARSPSVPWDDFPATAPASWLQRGGVVMPMYQSEALWISFSARYPFAVKIAAGKINAVSGAAWTAELHSEPQDYVVVPGQPWLDGFAVGAGLIRQFVRPAARRG